MAKRRHMDPETIADSPKSFYNGCVGKKRHPSRRAAMGVARAMGKTEMHAYKCRFCKGYHLGH